MVALLQKVLQLYASRQLSQHQAGQSGSSSGGDALDAALSELLAADESEWAALLRQHAQEGAVRWVTLYGPAMRYCQTCESFAGLAYVWPGLHCVIFKGEGGRLHGPVPAEICYTAAKGFVQCNP